VRRAGRLCRPGDTYAWTDVFVRDRKTGTTERVSLYWKGKQSSGYSSLDGMSAAGASWPFSLDATNLVPHGTGGAFNIFGRAR
jgi:hypothetical protein